MAAEKRPASNVFGSQQMVVKRQKSDANLNSGNALTVTNGLAQVSLLHLFLVFKEFELSYV